MHLDLKYKQSDGSSFTVIAEEFYNFLNFAQHDSYYLSLQLIKPWMPINQKQIKLLHIVFQARR